ncbi:TonB-dependent receptor [Rhodonellum sp.]|uniref:TonB-dependent receptor n=1 Tax=Rhodonellum sp. TaxID=2231180 RepID=UPI00272A5CAC|nr:TonB-dependent receptor [Rhodonellum sp.]
MLFLSLLAFNLLTFVEEISIGKQDTLDLRQIEVFSMPLDKYTFGQTVKTISEKDIKNFQGQSLADLLQQRTGLFLRQYGPGMLASLTMRGTSAGHNAVFWNGLPINSPSLGQSDFSILPVGGFDQATLHYGSGGALYGTDAIGGAVHLSNKLQFDKGHQVKINTVFGSFGRWNQSAAYAFSDHKFSSRSRIYRNHAQNNFKFTNLAKIGTPIENQNHARVEQWGVMQDLAWKISDKNLISSSIWWNLTERQIQPVMGSNDRDKQEDDNLRVVLDYFHFGSGKVWNLKTGMVRDHLEFNQSTNRTAQYFLSGDLDWDLGSKWNSKSGVRFTYIEGNLSTYAATDTRLELYQSTNFFPTESISLSLNLRQLVYEGNFAPFTPSLGGEWTVLKNENHQLQLNTSISRSFKVPTLNDRFWVPGGNLDLKPEKSLSGELGLKHDFKKGDLTGSNQVTYYHMSVDNWIIWLPNGSFWSPSNIRKVKNSGLEYFLEANQKLGLWTVGVQGNYAWNQAINQTNINDNDRAKGKQLPYTPEHKIQFKASVEKGRVETYVNHHWVGERFIGTDNTTKLPPFGIWDSGVNYDFELFGKLKGGFGVQINNVLNTDYQVLRLRAMPGRNYQININITL